MLHEKGQKVSFTQREKQWLEDEGALVVVDREASTAV